RPKVAKTDLLQFIKENQIQLHEVNLGGEAAERNQKLAEQRDKVFAENNKLWSDHLRYADLLTNEERKEYHALADKAGPIRTYEPSLTRKQNRRGQWAWFNGDSQVSGAFSSELDQDNDRSTIS